MEQSFGSASALPSSEPQPAAPAARHHIILAYAGQGIDYLGLQFVNWALTLVTLGFYYPWARARELNFMIGSLVADRDAFTFHGTGRELFWGFLRAWALFLLPIAGLGYLMSLPDLGAELETILMIAFYVAVFAFVMFAIVGSLRYRASRTSWRGIRFGFDGRFGEFGPAYAVRALAMMLSLGLVYPLVATWRRNYMLTHARLGSERFGFDGVAGDLFPSYLLCWFLTLPTLGLSMAWFHGRQQAYFWNHTTLAGGRFRSTLTGGEWLGITLLNGLLVTFTFGLGAPFAYVNLHREFFGRLSLEGAELARIHATASAGTGTGEAAAGLLDVDAGVDIG
jgi:uncharacterized membrane protein YjgN (DUF898 family)